MAKGTEKDLFHGEGNSTVGLPKNINSGKKILVNPHGQKPGKLLSTKKVTQKGWSK